MLRLRNTPLDSPNSGNGYEHHFPLANAAPTQERVLVIYTGGTIGMQPNVKGLAPGGIFKIAWQTH